MVPALEISEPKKFGMREVVLENLLAVVPSLLLFGSISVGFALGIVAAVSINFIYLAVGLMLLLLGGVTLFHIPVVAMNPYVRKINRKIHGPKPDGTVCSDCQVMLSPRLYKGWRGLLEDADDVGRIEVTNEGISFVGDHICLSLPFESIEQLNQTNCGPRVLWLSGPKFQFLTLSLRGYVMFEFHERESNNVLASHRISREIISAVEKGLANSPRASAP